jgi:isochorismate pyruvate lyase
MTRLDSLDDVRVEIDRVDREIVKLVAERDGFVREVVRFKTTTADVEAPQRVEAVISKVRTLATEHGTSPDIVEAIYRAMIAGFIEQEKQALGLDS